MYKYPNEGGIYILTIFISHAARDRELAEQLKMEIHAELGLSDNEVFLSSYERAIQKQDWKAEVEDALFHATILIPLITPCSAKSIWVGVEYGHFWAQNSVRNDGKQRFVFPLHIPKVSIPSPLDRDTSVSVMSETALVPYFEKLCSSLGVTGRRKLNPKAIVEKANRIHLLTGEEAKWQMEGKLYLNIATTVEDKQIVIDWMIEMDILQGINLHWNKHLNKLNFQEANLFRANLGGCELKNARFWGANLEEAILGSAQLQGADFSHAVLTGTRFGGAVNLDENTILPDQKRYRD
ncbi:MAG: TIR domain-containing protein, partial [Caedimonadaceae bacterium]